MPTFQNKQKLEDVKSFAQRSRERDSKMSTQSHKKQLLLPHTNDAGTPRAT